MMKQHLLEQKYIHAHGPTWQHTSLAHRFSPCPCLLCLHHTQADSGAGGKLTWAHTRKAFDMAWLDTLGSPVLNSGFLFVFTAATFILGGGGGLGGAAAAGVRKIQVRARVPFLVCECVSAYTRAAATAVWSWSPLSRS
jgi:hypothetical protein